MAGQAVVRTDKGWLGDQRDACGQWLAAAAGPARPGPVRCGADSRIEVIADRLLELPDLQGILNTLLLPMPG